MFKGRRVGVVVPSYNGAGQIDKVLETMPDYVDRVFVIDDCSTDTTADVVTRWVKRLGSRVDLIQHHKTSGIGATVKSGYRAALDSGIEVVAVMTGDGRMDPLELHLVLDPVVLGRVAYAKGNRLASGIAWQKTPRIRYLGGVFLSMLTKVASGYWHVADAQSAYSAISANALRAVDIDDLHHSYSYVNDLLIRLNIENLPVADVQITPHHGVDDIPSVPVWRFVPVVWAFLVRGFFFRMFQKYLVRDFHPIFFTYVFGALFGLIGLVLGVWAGWSFLHNDVAVGIIVLASVFLFAGAQLSLVAMWFDMEYNRGLG